MIIIVIIFICVKLPLYTSHHSYLFPLNSSLKPYGRPTSSNSTRDLKIGYPASALVPATPPILHTFLLMGSVSFDGCSLSYMYDDLLDFFNSGEPWFNTLSSILYSVSRGVSVRSQNVRYNVQTRKIGFSLSSGHFRNWFLDWLS